MEELKDGTDLQPSDMKRSETRLFLDAFKIVTYTKMIEKLIFVKLTINFCGTITKLTCSSITVSRFLCKNPSHSYST